MLTSMVECYIQQCKKLYTEYRLYTLDTTVARPCTVIQITQ